MRKKFPAFLLRFLQHLAISLLGLGVFLIVSKGAAGQPAHALPEYAERTGESCAACHVNPGGGGPRTLRGLLWAARGRPDALPELPGAMLAPGVSDGQELYEIACAGCHGVQGEGLYAIELAGTGISRAALRSFILTGLPKSGMPAFEGKLDPGQVDALVDYLAKLASGEIAAPEDEIPLPEAVFRCDPNPLPDRCGELPK